MSDDRDDEVGYGKPPKKSQFKKGQSGCPDGGHAQRRAKKAKHKQKAQEEEKKRIKEITNAARAVMLRERTVMTADGPKQMANFEIAMSKFAERCNGNDATTQDFALYFKIAEKLKFMEPPAEGPRPMVLVVNAIPTAEEWAKRTEGELLTKNPLEGIPGLEGALDAPARRPRTMPDDDE